MMVDKQQQMEWPTSRVRNTFINFFKEQCSHEFVRSSKVIPHNDETLKFCNAGMNQFKPIFLSTVDPSSDLGKLKRAANSQKCIRAGGKHNDLDDVGKDSYHHTFFEMLGNWSFGDYFKEEAIKWAWKLLTEVYKLDADRLYVTYFRGNEEFNLAPDLETKDLWTNVIGLAPERVLPFGMKENFWEMGATGPCGPCTEIHYDRLGGRDAAALVNMDDPMVIEIWNLVFIQFNREDSKTLNALRAKHVDTGMGLERITSILQRKMSNYDIDIFFSIFQAIQVVTGCPHAYSGLYGEEDGAINFRDTAYRIVADHIRTLVIAITDGARPSGVHRGSVIRRILRRAARYGSDILGGKTGFFSQLVPAVVETLKDAFPELEDQENIKKIQEILLAEEISFEKLLKRGLKRFKKAVDGKAEGYVIPGDVAAILHHTDGFPIDLTIRMAEENKMSVDKKAYKEEIKRHKVESGKKSSLGEETLGEFKNLNVITIDELKERLKVATNDLFKYKNETLESSVAAIWSGHEFVESTEDYDQVALFFPETNFYAEQGGQTNDTGLLTSLEDNNKHNFQVVDVQLAGMFVFHVVRTTNTKVIRVGERLRLDVNYERRKPIMANHTATHMVNFALLKVMGEHVSQKGSDVLPESFRFDYTTKGKPEVKQLQQVEDLVNEIIQQERPVFSKEISKNDAMTINGLRRLEGEAYPDPVRVVSIGVAVEELLNNPNNPAWSEVSIELCGGTHLNNSKDAEKFIIVREEALAAEVRRVVCVTGDEARKAIVAADAFEAELESSKSLSAEELSVKVKTLEESLNKIQIAAYKKHLFRNNLKELNKIVLDHQKQSKKGKANEASDIIETLKQRAHDGSLKFVVEVIEGYQRKQLADFIKTLFEATMVPVLVLNLDQKKIDLMSQVPPALQAQLPADEWAKAAVAVSDGAKAGGKADRANGNISKIGDLEKVKQNAEEFARSKL